MEDEKYKTFIDRWEVQIRKGILDQKFPMHYLKKVLYLFIFVIIASIRYPFPKGETIPLPKFAHFGLSSFSSLASGLIIYRPNGLLYSSIQIKDC